jgi:hypothetical protein
MFQDEERYFMLEYRYSEERGAADDGSGWEGRVAALLPAGTRFYGVGPCRDGGGVAMVIADFGATKKRRKYRLEAGGVPGLALDGVVPLLSGLSKSHVCRSPEETISFVDANVWRQQMKVRERADASGGEIVGELLVAELQGEE